MLAAQKSQSDQDGCKQRIVLSIVVDVLFLPCGENRSFVIHSYLCPEPKPNCLLSFLHTMVRSLLLTQGLNHERASALAKDTDFRRLMIHVAENKSNMTILYCQDGVPLNWKETPERRLANPGATQQTVLQSVMKNMREKRQKEKQKKAAAKEVMMSKIQVGSTGSILTNKSSKDVGKTMVKI